MKLRETIIACLGIHLAVMSWAAAPMPELPKSRLGIHRSNLAWEKDEADAPRILKTIHDRGISLVRLSLQQSNQKELDKIYRHLEICRDYKMDVILFISLFEWGLYKDYRAAVRPGREGVFDAPRASAIEPDRFEKAMRHFMKGCRDRKIPLYALELGNEYNWADFNGDLPLREPGTTHLYTRNDDAKDPDVQKIAQGMRRVAECHVRLRKVVDELVPGRTIKIITGGLANPEPGYAQKMGMTLADPGWILSLLEGKDARFPNPHPVSRYVDGVGVHLYPDPVKNGQFQGLKAQVNEVVAKLQQPFSALMPIWWTEWGYAAYPFGADLNGELLRLENMKRFLQAVRETKMPQGAMVLFSFDQMNHAVWENGKWLNSADIFGL